MFCKNEDDYIHDYILYRKSLLNFKRIGTVFEDHDFHPFKKIDEPKLNIDLQDEVEWRRIDEVFKGALFDENLININYIKQGSIGDCYFITALSCISKEPKLILNLFDKAPNYILGIEPQSINLKCGIVAIYFHVFGIKIRVIIDTLIPFYKGTNKPVFGNLSDPNMSPWFLLVEKAYAKLLGSYSNIVTGNFNYAIYTLCGYIPIFLSKSYLQQNEIKTKKSPFIQLSEYIKQGCIMDCSIHLEDDILTEDEIEKADLVTNHSYLIEKMVKTKDKNFICLKNPWGRHEWKGDYSDKSDK